MKKVAIVTDSIACLNRELVTQYEIGIMPLNFYYGGKIYRDWIDVTPSQAYELFLADQKSFKTSATSPETCYEVFREAGKTAKNIFCITVSSKISTVYNSALAALEQAKAELPDIHIELMDSYTATIAEGLIAMAAARAAEAGKELSDVIKSAEAIKQNIHCYVLLDTIRYVYRSGRIPQIAAHAASMLNIKPILTLSSGVVKFITAVRSRPHGIDRMLSMMKSKVGDNPIRIAVTHAYALEEAEKLKNRIASEFNCTDIWLSEFSPLMGYACGTGTLGIAFHTESAESNVSPDK